MAVNVRTKSVKLCDVDGGRRPVFLTVDDKLRIGAGRKPFRPADLNQHVDKGDARTVRRALAEAGRRDLVVATLTRIGGISCL